MGLIDWNVRYKDTVATPLYKLEKEQLWDVYRWRNDARIRRWMVRTSPIEIEEHQHFVQGLADADDQTYLRVDSVPGIDNRKYRGLGVVILTHVAANRSCAEIGLYRNPENDQPGLGYVLMELIESIAKDLGINTLKLKVRRDNSAAIRLYDRFGYTVFHVTGEFEHRQKQLQRE